MERIRAMVQAAQSEKESFDEALAIRGKKRQPAIDAWYDEHPEHAFAMTYELLQHKSKSRKKLGEKMLATLPLTPDNREAMAELCTELLQGSRYSLYPLALGLLRRHPGLIPGTVDTLAAFAPRTNEPEQALEALELVEKAAQDNDEVTLEQVTPIFEAALDHWSTEVQERAAELLVEHGGTPRDSMWKGCPLSESVRRQIARLGGRIVGNPNPDAPRTIGSWEAGAEATAAASEAVSEVPWPIAYFSDHVQLPFGLDDYDRDFDKSYGPGSGLNHANLEGGRQLFLHDVMYEENLQWFVTLDLTDTSSDPRARGYDHEGWDRGSLGSLSKFLSTLKTP